MESWENKIWADKLNSLQEFPTGYAPDLSSKWEIVEAGLPTGKKRRIAPLLVRWSVAAAVLLSIFFLWVNNDWKSKEETVAITQPVRKIPLRIRRQQVATVTDNLKVLPIKETAFLQVKKNLTMTVSAPQEVMVKAEVEPAFSLPDTIIKQDTITVSSQTGLASITPVEKVKAVKKRIYQRDFNDGILAMDTSFSPSARQHFSIQLNPFARKAEDGEPPARRLQLKQAL